MPQKTVHVDLVGDVVVTRRKGARSLRLRLSHDGAVHVTVPYWMPYRAGAEFASQRTAWIVKHRPAARVLGADDAIGKHHSIRVAYAASAQEVKVRLHGGEIRATVPFGVDLESERVQSQLHSYAVKALRHEAKEYLPDRLAQLATDHDFTYRDVRIRNMTSRWGSCTSQQDISLSLYLMQLDDDLIDYVILHELLHTQILRHGKVFWDALAQYVPDLPAVRKRMRQHRPGLS